MLSTTGGHLPCPLKPHVSRAPLLGAVSAGGFSPAKSTRYKWFMTPTRGGPTHGCLYPVSRTGCRTHH